MGKVLQFKRPTPPSVEEEPGKEVIAIKALKKHFTRLELEAIRADLDIPLPDETPK